MRIACLFYYSTMRYYSMKFCRRVVDGCRRYAGVRPRWRQCSLAPLARECHAGVGSWAVYIITSFGARSLRSLANAVRVWSRGRHVPQ